MSNLGGYEDLTTNAKEAGGPEIYLENIKNEGIIEGISEGKNKGKNEGFFGALLVVGAIYLAIEGGKKLKNYFSGKKISKINQKEIQDNDLVIGDMDEYSNNINDTDNKEDVI